MIKASKTSGFPFAGSFIRPACGIGSLRIPPKGSTSNSVRVTTGKGSRTSW